MSDISNKKGGEIMLIGWCGRVDCESDCRDCYRVPEDEAG